MGFLSFSKFRPSIYDVISKIWVHGHHLYIHVNDYVKNIDDIFESLFIDKCLLSLFSIYLLKYEMRILVIDGPFFSSIIR